jgi:hypothetical protein
MERNCPAGVSFAAPRATPEPLSRENSTQSPRSIFKLLVCIVLVKYMNIQYMNIFTPSEDAPEGKYTTRSALHINLRMGIAPGRIFGVLV